MAKARVAILTTRAETVIKDYDRLGELAGMREALDPKAPTILKDGDNNTVALFRLDKIARYTVDTSTGS